MCLSKRVFLIHTTEIDALQIVNSEAYIKVGTPELSHMSDSNKSLDVLGMKPVAEAVSTVTTATIAGVGALLSRICLPAAEELGLHLRDKVGAWRARNLAAVAAQAEAMLNRLPDADTRHAHPRLVSTVIESASWIDDFVVQRMWAGLLASGCSTDGRDHSNVIFTALLTQLTPSQARLLRHACVGCTKSVSPAGLVVAARISVPNAELLAIADMTDLHELDLQLDHLRGTGLFDIASGLHPGFQSADMCPTALGLQLFIRSEGFLGSPIEYFGL